MLRQVIEITDLTHVSVFTVGNDIFVQTDEGDCRDEIKLTVETATQLALCLRNAALIAKSEAELEGWRRLPQIVVLEDDIPTQPMALSELEDQDAAQHAQ